MTPPRPQEHLFEKSYAAELLKIAEGDLLSAEALNESTKGRRENICFLAQMPGSAMPPMGYNLSVLTSYATVRRYEESRSLLTPEAIQSVLDAGREILRWAKAQCQ